MPNDQAAPAVTGGMAVDLDALSDGCALDRFLRCSETLRAAGTAIIGMSDRRRSDVIQMFPGIRSEVDALIYEHGCVAEVGGRLFPMAHPVPQFVGASLRRSGIAGVGGQVAILVGPADADAAESLFGDSVEVDVDVDVVPLGAVIRPRSASESAALAFVAEQLGVPVDRIIEAHSASALLEALRQAQIDDARGAHGRAE